MVIAPDSFKAKWHYPTHVYFAVDALAQLSQHLGALGGQRPLLVVDAFLVGTPLIQKMLVALAAADITVSVFSDFTSNPTTEQVAQGVAAYKAHAADVVIGLGGGSALDLAKMIALMCGQTGNVLDFIDEGDNYLGANADVIAPIIAIPTTAGTGSEVGRAAVVTDADTHAKKLIFHPKMLPEIVICDPLLSQTLPPVLTAATGMDALAHNLEALCAPGFHPQADGIALEGLRLIHTYLLPAVTNGDDLSARSYMMAAALMGAAAFQKGLGAVHALSHPIGGLYDLHHGTLNAIFMPYVLVFNRPYIEDKMIRLARYLDLATYDFNAVLDWVIALNQALELPATLQEVGVDLSQADAIVAGALADPSGLTNPRPVSAAAYHALLTAAVNGDMTVLASLQGD